MPKRSAQKRKAAPKTSNSFLEKLHSLREIVGTNNFSESDLSSCLRQCGCNTELAVERLITGEYKSKPKSNNVSNFLTKTPSNKTTKTSSNAATSVNKRPRVTPSTSSTTRRASAASQGSEQSSSSSSIDSVPRNNAIVNSNSSARPSPPPQRPPNGHHLWLCERWIVGLSTTKNAKFMYQEQMSLSHASSGPPIVRFKGQNVEGTLRQNISSLLTPLLRSETPLISLQAHALMEERGVPIGGDVPLCLRIFIEDPVAFFRLFETNDGSTESAASQFFGSSKKKQRGRPRKHLRLPIADAAFALLQWAQYGDDPTFEPPSEAREEESSSQEEDNEEESVLEESEFEASDSNEDKTNTPEWAKSVVDETTELPEASDPSGFANDVVLRPYQRQALYWMMERESGNDKRDDLEKELSLLAELSRNASSPRVEPPPPEQDICCEVGPVRVSKAAELASRTIEGIQNPVSHPLWQRRFLASADKQCAISFYVNELLGIASSKPPNPPRHCVGGILGDAMGLGKTVMLMALIMKGREGDGGDDDDDAMMVDAEMESNAEDKKPAARQSNRTTLVVAPLSLVSQWEEELATKTDLTNRVYYAESAKGGIHSKTFKGIDVVVTTYGTIQGELLAEKKTGSIGSGLLSYNWHRVILDESHCIKNPSTVVARACCMLKADKRWCVTGTPIQNSLEDVYALLKFLKHEPWCETAFWKAAITNAAPDDSEDESKLTQSSQTAIALSQSQSRSGAIVAQDRVKRLLAPLILRRTKDTLDKDGQPILKLPPLDVLTVNVELSVAEREFYNSLLERSQTVFEGFIKSGIANKSWLAIFSLLNRLRQTCDHVALTVKSQLNDDEWNPDSLEITSPSKKAASPVARRTPKAASKDADALGEEFLEGLLEKFRSKHDKKNVEANYASQVAHALAKTIESSATTMEDECPICLDHPLIEETVITPCAHVFCRECLVGILERNGDDKEKNAESSSTQCPNGICPSCNEPIDAKRIITLSKSSEEGDRVTTSYLHGSPPKNASVAAKEESTMDSSHLAARQTLEKALRGAGSSKLTAVIRELHNVWEKDPRSKVLIFSQYLGFLDLLEVALAKNGIPSGRFDGKLSLKERVAVLDKFRQEVHPMEDDADADDRSSRIGSVLLMSMKAGGVGINMVAASTAFICDPWYNEACEDQCISRIHRIGQEAKVVRVRKFIVRDSVEERIVLLQQRKKNMASDVLSDANGGELSAANDKSTPTLDDFKTLFGR